MQIGKVQDPQVALPTRQYLSAGAAEGVLVGLPACVGDAGEAGRESAHRQGRRRTHGLMVADVGENAHMSALKDTLQSDLTAATIRMVLTAVTNEEVSGKEARQLSDDDVLTVLGREAKKRREAAEAYDAANRPELAARERDELGVIARYLPQQLTDDEVRGIVDAAVAEVAATGATGGQAMGAVMKLVQPQVKGRADGGEVAALVKSALGLT